jgi:FKBP-type peptidyl-prolyl cis-trans isomerase SlyD
VDIPAKDAYGEKYDEMIQKVPRSSLQGVNDLKVGMQLEAEAENQTVVVMVTEVTDEFVTVDGNHPLAGVDLTFDVEIVEVRAATAEELDHGHVHGEHGHHH